LFYCFLGKLIQDPLSTSCLTPALKNRITSLLRAVVLADPTSKGRLGKEGFHWKELKFRLKFISA
jgi:hypothetical protein